MKAQLFTSVPALYAIFLSAQILEMKSHHPDNMRAYIRANVRIVLSTFQNNIYTKS